MHGPIRTSWLALVFALALGAGACGGSTDDPTGGTGGKDIGAGGDTGTGGTGGTGGDEIPWNPDDCKEPTIERIEPDRGGEGTQVRVFGNCFNPQSFGANEAIFAGGRSAAVMDVSSNGKELVTSVPRGAQTGPVAILSNYGSGQVRSEDGPVFTVTDDALPPGLNSINPSSVTAGSGALEITLNGTGFVSRSEVLLNDEPLPNPTTSSPTSIKVTVPASAVASPGTLSIKVRTPPPGGGTSPPVLLQVVPPVDVIDAYATAINEVQVVFNKPISRTGMGQRSDWVITHGATRLTVQEATRGRNNQRIVVLRTSSQVPNVEYTVTVPETITANDGAKIGQRSANFRSWGSDPEQVGTYGAGIGCGNAGLDDPSALTFADGVLWVTERGGNQVQVVDKNGKFLGWLGHDGSQAGFLDSGNALGCPGAGSDVDGALASPLGHVAVLPNGNQIVADTENDRVLVYGVGGNFVGVHGVTEWERPVVLGMIKGSVWILNGADGQVYRFPEGQNLPVGSPLFGTGTTAGRFAWDLDGEGRPTAAWNFANDEVFITDPGNHRVQKFTGLIGPQGWIGRGMTQFGSAELSCLDDGTCAGSERGEFTNPRGVAVGPNGTVWVVDDGRMIDGAHVGRVQRFSSSGRWEDDFQLGYRPGGIAFDDDGFMWIADRDDGVLHKYRP